MPSRLAFSRIFSPSRNASYSGEQSRNTRLMWDIKVGASKERAKRCLADISQAMLESGAVPSRHENGRRRVGTCDLHS